MNRRRFLEILSQASILYTFDIDKLLWVPGTKKIFIPKPTIISVYHPAYYGLTYNMYPWSIGPWMGIKRD